MSDAVNSPAHYNKLGDVECIELTELMPFNEGNAVKYIWRAGEKGSAVEDLRKALWYIYRSEQSGPDWGWQDDFADILGLAAVGFVASDQPLKAVAIQAIAANLHTVARAAIEKMIEEAGGPAPDP